MSVHGSNTTIRFSGHEKTGGELVVPMLVGPERGIFIDFQFIVEKISRATNNAFQQPTLDLKNIETLLTAIQADLVEANKFVLQGQPDKANNKLELIKRNYDKISAIAAPVRAALIAAAKPDNEYSHLLSGASNSLEKNLYQLRSNIDKLDNKLRRSMQQGWHVAPHAKI